MEEGAGLRRAGFVAFLTMFGAAMLNPARAAEAPTFVPNSALEDSVAYVGMLDALVRRATVMAIVFFYPPTYVTNPQPPIVGTPPPPTPQPPNQTQPTPPPTTPPSNPPPVAPPPPPSPPPPPPTNGPPPENGPPPVASSPEPTTLLSGIIGCSVLGLFAAHRRRRKGNAGHY